MKIIIIILSLISLTTVQKALPLYIVTITGTDSGKTEVKTTVTGAYFEVELASQTLKDGTKNWVARKDIQKSGVGQPFLYVFFYVTDEKGERVLFKTSTDFLNYMDSHGYAMVTQKEAKFHTDYTFKKK